MWRQLSSLPPPSCHNGHAAMHESVVIGLSLSGVAGAGSNFGPTCTCAHAFIRYIHVAVC